MRNIEIKARLNDWDAAHKIAAVLATFDKRPRAAEDFWMPVATGAGFMGNHEPGLRLRTLLADIAVKSHSKDKVNMTPEQIYRVCLYCWNKWRDGEELRTTPRVPDHRPPVRG